MFEQTSHIATHITTYVFSSTYPIKKSSQPKIVSNFSPSSKAEVRYGTFKNGTRFKINVFTSYTTSVST